MSTFSETAPFIDAPFLFNVLTHWNKGLDADLLKPAMRDIFINKPMGSLAEIKGLKVRMQCARILVDNLTGRRDGRP
jgi:TRAP-type transport system periplasmic protein